MPAFYRSFSLFQIGVCFGSIAAMLDDRDYRSLDRWAVALIALYGIACAIVLYIYRKDL